MYDNITPYIRVAWYSTLPPGRFIKTRIIFDYELLYIKEGSCVITVEDLVYHPSVGDLFIFRPGKRHSLYVPENTYLVQPHIHFDLQHFDDAADVFVPYKLLEEMSELEKSYIRPDILDDFLSPFPTHIHLQNPQIIEQMLVDVIYAHNNVTLFPELNEKWLFLRLFYQLLFEITIANTNHRNIQHETALRIKLYLEQNICKNVTLDELAHMSNTSKSYLIKVFKNAYRTTPAKFHTLQKINRSKYLLKCSNQTISEIALSLGFDSIHSFSRCFRKYEAMSLSEFRKQSASLPERNRLVHL